MAKGTEGRAALGSLAGIARTRLDDTRADFFGNKAVLLGVGYGTSDALGTKSWAALGVEVVLGAEESLGGTGAFEVPALPAAKSRKYLFPIAD
ncbi:hypothetical protein AALP_AAs60263U000100 [Arabis alpina]|uniref:Uncharacterized protein n=1 Tax=Arabis alpina TaxID=50452 RepID=A0A087G3N4_ARAAL|nr:hypothetical protein AALP_AAs60263U000100 [Arabis alpina]